MDRIWAMVRHNTKMVNQNTVPCAPEFWRDDAQLGECIHQVLVPMDVPSPVWLPKHTRQMEQFGHTLFNAGDFLEPITFDVLEVRYLPEDDDEKKRKRGHLSLVDHA